MSVSNKLGHKWFSIMGTPDGRLMVVSNHGESQGGGVCTRQYWKPVVTLPVGFDKKEWRDILIPFLQGLKGTRYQMSEAIKQFIKGREGLSE